MHNVDCAKLVATLVLGYTETKRRVSDVLNSVRTVTCSDRWGRLAKVFDQSLPMGRC